MVNVACDSSLARVRILKTLILNIILLCVRLGRLHVVMMMMMFSLISPAYPVGVRYAATNSRIQITHCHRQHLSVVDSRGIVYLLYILAL